MEHQCLQTRRPSHVRNFSSQGMSRCGNTPNADARSHELRYGDQGASAQILALVIKIFQALFQFARPTGFPLSANSCQRPPNIRFISLWHNVSLASAQEDSRGSPATANERDLAVRYRAKQRVQHLHRCVSLPCIPAEITSAPCGGVNGSVPAHHRLASASERR